VSSVRAVDDAKRRSPAWYRLARLAGNSRSIARADLKHLLRGWKVDGIRYEVTSSKLFQGDLALCEFLVNEAQLVVLQQNLQAKLVSNLVAGAFDRRLVRRQQTVTSRVIAGLQLGTLVGTFRKIKGKLICIIQVMQLPFERMRSWRGRVGRGSRRWSWMLLRRRAIHVY
jgi:hypothetical protein